MQNNPPNYNQVTVAFSRPVCPLSSLFQAQKEPTFFITCYNNPAERFPGTDNIPCSRGNLPLGETRQFLPCRKLWKEESENVREQYNYFIYMPCAQYGYHSFHPGFLFVRLKQLGSSWDGGRDHARRVSLKVLRIQVLCFLRKVELRIEEHPRFDVLQNLSLYVRVCEVNQKKTRQVQDCCQPLTGKCASSYSGSEHQHCLGTSGSSRVTWWTHGGSYRIMHDHSACGSNGYSFYAWIYKMSLKKRVSLKIQPQPGIQNIGKIKCVSFFASRANW